MRDAAPSSRTVTRGGLSGRLLAALPALLAILPLVGLLAAALGGSLGHWSHLFDHVLPRATLQTAGLLLGVGVMVAVLGTGSAWAVTAYDFPGRKLLSWALLLPLAVPTYIVAYAYLDLMHPLGPLQSGLRALLGIADPRGLRLPDVRSLGGAIVLLSFVLYPYVYLSTRALFLTQAAELLEAARSLGAGPFQVFRRVALPLARPAIAVGMVLALLETLNDIGASEFLGVQTLTVSIYTTWLSRGDLPGAAQLALAMLGLVAVLVFLEVHSRRERRYAPPRSRPMVPARLRGPAGLLVMALTALPVVIGFLLPTSHLVVQTFERLQSTGGASLTLWKSLGNTLFVAAATTACTLLVGILLVALQRIARVQRRGGWETSMLKISSIGYAVPGTVLALGLLLPFGTLDAGISTIAETFGAAPRLFVMGSIGALVFACTVRFLAISAGGLEAGMARIPPSLDEAAHALGRGPGAIVREVHVPLLRPALATAALLVFVDTMKELPATLMLRPMNFETLATWLYADAARGAYEEGAIAALLIVVAGLLPVILLSRAGSDPRSSEVSR